MRGIFRLLYLSFSAAVSLLAAEVENGSFENGLSSWTVRGAGIRIDVSEKAFGSQSLHISQPEAVWQRIFQNLQLPPETEYEIEYYVKGRNIVRKSGARFGGASAGILREKPSPLYGSAGAWKLDDGSFDWRKVSFRFRTGSDAENVSLQLQLTNASGDVWFDGIRITRIDGKKAGKSALRADLYPLEFLQDSPFRIAENLIGTLVLKASGAAEYRDSPGEMIFEVPAFIRVIGGSPRIALTEEKDHPGKRVYAAYPVKEEEFVTEKGVRMRRFRMTFDSNFSRFVSVPWYSHAVFLRPEAGSAGKKGGISWQLKFGDTLSERRSGNIEVIPPIRHTARPCRKFRLMLATPPILRSPYPEERNIMNAFWQGIAEKPYVWIYSYNHELTGYTNVVMIGGSCWNLIPAMRKPLQELRTKLPRNVTDQGKPGHGFSIWSLVDDPDGAVERFLRKGVRELVKLCPDIRHCVWDFEPHPYGYDEGGRARFARRMKLKKTPSIAEINARYKHQWFRYMVDLHAQYIGKVALIFKEEAPQIQFHLCSDNLSSGAEPVSAWCGVDVRLSDSVVDGHMHMPYYAGIKFFDDVKFNIHSLKKPFFPLIDPAECLLSFYRQYTPDKVRQNILAVAALGGKGIGFWPDDAFTGDYHKVISEAYAMISGHEDFYAAGERCERDYRFTPVNAVAGKITNENGKEFTVYFPDFPRVFRTTVHRWNGEELFTLFNYHEQLPLLLEIRGNSRLYYAEIPPNGVVLLRSSDLRNQERLRRRAEEIRKKIAPDAGKLPELRKGKSALEWCAGSQGEPLFRLSNGTIQATVDVLGDGRIREIFNSSHAPLLNSGFLNRLMFYDTHQQPVSWKLGDLKIEQDIPEITLHGTVPPYAGANPQENPLMGLQLSFRYALSGETLLVDFKLRNPTAKSMKIGFRLNNYPKPGARFDTEKVQTVIRSENRMIPVDPLHENFLRQGETCSFFNGKSPLRWDGGRIFIFAEKGALSDEMAILPDKSFAGIYCWFGNKAQTVELLSPDFELAPGMEKIFRYQVELAPGNRKR